MQYVLKTPLSKQDLAPLKAGDTVLLSGVVYTARDAAHARMMELLDKGESLPFPIEGAAIYYVGPTPERPAVPSARQAPRPRAVWTPTRRGCWIWDWPA